MNSSVRQSDTLSLYIYKQQDSRLDYVDYPRRMSFSILCVAEQVAYICRVKRTMMEKLVKQHSQHFCGGISRLHPWLSTLAAAANNFPGTLQVTLYAAINPTWPVSFPPQRTLG